MKIFVFLLIIPAVPSIPCFSQNTIDSIELIQSSYSREHYHGYAETFYFSGEIYRDTANRIQYQIETYHDTANSGLYKYQYTSYYPNGKLKKDSIIDFTRDRKAFFSVSIYDVNGELVKQRFLHAKLSANRTSIPGRNEVLWNGRERVYVNGKRLKTERLRYIRY